MNLANHVRVASKGKNIEKKENAVVSKIAGAKEADKRKMLKKRFAQIQRSEDHGKA